MRAQKHRVSFYDSTQPLIWLESIVPKIKSKKAASKRFSLKKSGVVKRGKANKRHILTKKSRSRKNRLKKGGYVDPSNMGLVLRALPNG